MFSRQLNGRAVFEKLTGIQEFSGLPATSLGITSANQIQNALDITKEEYTTFDLLTVHILRMILTFFLFAYMKIFCWHSIITNTWELLKIFFFDLKIKSYKIKPEVSSNLFQLMLNSTIFWWETMFYIPGEAIKTLKQVSYCIPVGLKVVRNYLPKENTPNSVTLILDTIPNLVPPPPEIPQPYLDADRKITVPDPRELQYIIAIRNEYFTQYKSHIAAERVRLLREMSRFIAWTCLIPTITELTIYEKKGTAWDGDHFSALDSIKNSILVELVAFASTCDQKDLKEFKNQISKIILVHRYRKTRLVVNEEEIELSNTLALSQVPLNDEDADEVVDQVLDTYAERTMIVNLCDLRVRTSNFRELVHNGLHNPIESNDDIFNEEFPGTPDLVIAPSINGNASNKLLGYSCVDHNVEERKKAVVYFSHLDFGFQFFTRSLYHYALEKPLLHSGIEPSRNKVSGLIKQHPSKNIVHFFKKVTAIDLENKTNNQFVSTAI